MSQTITHKICHREARRREYPPIGDQLDAVGKLAASLKAQGMELPAETEQWLSQLQIVKDTFPK